jgi:hypothetical protein
MSAPPFDLSINSGIQVTSVRPGGTFTVPLAVHNLGARALSIRVSIPAMRGWAFHLTRSVLHLRPGKSVVDYLRVTVPHRFSGLTDLHVLFKGAPLARHAAILIAGGVRDTIAVHGPVAVVPVVSHFPLVPVASAAGVLAAAGLVIAGIRKIRRSRSRLSWGTTAASDVHPVWGRRVEALSS